jgi:hypothetical protein
VFTEGRETEPQYLTHLNRRNRSVSVRVDSRHAQPLKLAQIAVRTAKELKPDECWVVFDRDTHPSVAEALWVAERAGINVALSCPCFELWLIWHFEDFTKPAASHDDVRRRARELLHCDKVLSEAAIAELLSRTGEAMRRAVGADEQHVRSGAGGYPDPGSGLHLLVRSILG